MPLLDVTDVLLDPDFCETLTVTRSTQGGIVDHVPAFTAATLSITAVVQPAGSNDLQRLLDAEYTRGGVTVFGYGADVLQVEDTFMWQGDTYTVIGTDDWSRYGAGFVKATAAKTSLP